MKFESFIGLRYLFSREHKMLVSLITIISVLGVAVGVTALISVISVMDGFDNELVKKMMGAFSHIRVWNGFEERISNYEDLIKIIEKDPDVVAAAPVISTQAFMQCETGIETPKVGVQILGIDLIREDKVTDYMKKIVSGSGSPEYREVVLGDQLALRLQVRTGSPLYAITKLTKTPYGALPKTATLKVGGIFKTGLYDIDSGFAYCSLETLRNICLIEKDEVDYVQIKLKNPFFLEKVKERLSKTLGDRYILQSWDEINRDFFYALRLEKLVMFIILSLIIVVAAFNIIGTLIMVTTQKTREIGILKSMGASNSTIQKIFLFHGIFIGFVGTLLGVIFGIIVCWLLEHYIAYKLPAAVYGLETLPVDVQVSTVLIIVCSSLFICTVSSIIPASYASKLNPVEALRYE